MICLGVLCNKDEVRCDWNALLFNCMEADFKRSVDRQGLVPSGAPEDFGVIDSADVACMTLRLIPMPLLTHAEKLHLKQII